MCIIKLFIKIRLLLLLLAISSGLTACGGGSSESETNSQIPNVGENPPEEVPPQNETPDDESVVEQPQPVPPVPQPDPGQNPEPQPSPEPSTYDFTTRSGSLSFYEAAYLASEIEAGDWGDELYATCYPGDISAVARAKALQRLNYFRTLVGVPAVLDDSLLNAKAQKAAYVMQLQFDQGNYLTSKFHVPYDENGDLLDWDCLDQPAADALGNGNLSQHGSSHTVVDSVNNFIWDPGENNSSAGHRDGLFRQDLQFVGIGAASQTAVIMMNNAGNPEGGWTWPPKNTYVPTPILYQGYRFGYLPRWSIRDERAWILRHQKRVGITPVIRVIDCYGSEKAVSNIKVADNKLLTWEVDIDTSIISDECEFTVNIEQYYRTENEGDGAATGAEVSITYKTTLFNP